MKQKLIQVVLFLIVMMFLFACQRTGCECNDGTHSSATGSGACSHHKGVKRWKH